jgi:hypothetical protein
VQRDYTFQEHQEKLAEYCRTGGYQELPGIHSRERAETYRGLILNVVESTLSNAYPITRKVLGEEEWVRLVHAFFAEYPCQSPELWRMPYGLVAYVFQTGYGADFLPFLKDLLEFEWIEIEVYMMEDTAPVPYRSTGRLLDDGLVLNPSHRVTLLRYPVFQLSVDDLKADLSSVRGLEGLYPLLTYRHPETCHVYFVEISPFHLRLLQLIEQDGYAAREAAEISMKEFRLQDLEAGLSEVEAFLKQLLDDQVILGFREVLS